MSSRSKQMALYDIPSLPDSMVKQKYLQTVDIYNDPNTISNFMKEAIRDTGSDAPLFEQDMPRQSRNPLSQSILNTQEHGSRYTHAPFHPELFLGDLTSDPRMSTTQPLTAKLAEQNKFRQERYIRGKLQDVGEERTEGLVGNKRMLRQIKQGFNNTATRMGGIFNDSNDTSVRRTNPNPGNSTHKVGDTVQEDQKIYQVNEETIIPQYSDVVSKLSNLIGVQWDVQPDQKYGLSSVSNVYRSKQEVDQSKNAVFRLGEQETKFKTEKSDIKTAANVKSLDSFKAARKDAQNVEVLMKKDSMKNRFASKMQPPQGPINLVDRFVGTQSSKRQIETKGVVNKFHTGQNRVESLVEPIKERKNVVAQRPTSVPIKDRLVISYKVGRTQKMSNRSEDQRDNRSIGYKMLKSAMTNRVKMNLEPQKNIINHQAVRFTNNLPGKPIDHVSNVRTTNSKFTEPKELTAANKTGSNVLPTPSSVDDFLFDTDPTMNNEYQTRRGYSQKMTRLSELQEQDNQVSPLNDTIAPFRTNYGV